MLFPVFVYLQQGSAAFDSNELSAYWRIILNLVESIGLSLNLLTLLSLAAIPLVAQIVLSGARVFYIHWLIERVKAKLREQAVEAFVISHSNMQERGMA